MKTETASLLVALESLQKALTDLKGSAPEMARQLKQGEKVAAELIAEIRATQEREALS